MPHFKDEHWGVEFDYSEFLKLKETDESIKLLSSRSSDGDPYKDRMYISVFNSSGNLISEMNRYLNQINRSSDVEEFDSTVADDITNRGLGTGKEATFSFIDKTYDWTAKGGRLTVKGKAFIAKKSNAFLRIALYAHSDEYNGYISAYNLVKTSINFI